MMARSSVRFTAMSPVADEPDFEGGATSDGEACAVAGIGSGAASALRRTALGATAAAAAGALALVLASGHRAAPAAPTDAEQLFSRCAAPGEDCRLSYCCQQEGHTCYEKNQWWAACMDSCTPGQPREGDDGTPWTCKAVTEPPRDEGTCSWPGEPCQETSRCCMRGFECIVKESSLALCQQAEVGPWDGNGKPARKLPPPANWSGAVRGGWYDEYLVAPAGVGEPRASTTLFCFHAVLPGSYEDALVEAARCRKAGIFGCEQYAIYQSVKAEYHKWDSGYSTLVNTGGFMRVWDQVRDGGLYLKTDWTLKVDADCVFFPARIRSHLAALNAPAGKVLYVKNTRPNFLAGGFLGAVEILSSKATDRLVRNIRVCEKYMGTMSGEDGFLKDCMDALGAGYLQDKVMLHPDQSVIGCQLEEFAAYHPMKDTGSWVQCYDIAAGNNKNPPELLWPIVNMLPSEIRGKYSEQLNALARARAEAAARAAAEAARIAAEAKAAAEAAAKAKADAELKAQAAAKAKALARGEIKAAPTHSTLREQMSFKK